MRVVALVSLAFALMASSMPLYARTNGVSATENQLTGDLGSAGGQSGKVTKLGSGLKFGKLGDRSNIVNSFTGTGSSGTEVASQLGGVESTAGKVTSATNPATHGTPLRWRTTTENVPGAGSVTNKVTGEVNSADKATQGKGLPTDAEGTAKGAAGGATGSLTGSGPGTQLGNVSP